MAFVLFDVHSPEECAGRPCVIHNPSDHHMRDWPTEWRADKRMMERICAHGVGHPDPDDLAWHTSQGRGYRAVHGCDWCCRPAAGQYSVVEQVCPDCQATGYVDGNGCRRCFGWGWIEVYRHAKGEAVEIPDKADPDRPGRGPNAGISQP